LALGLLAGATAPPPAGADPPEGQGGARPPGRSIPDSPIRFSIAGGAGTVGPDGAPRDPPGDLDAFLRRQLARANEIFVPVGVTFAEAGRDRLPDGHGVLDDRGDRHALGPLVADDAIHVFVVAFLRDVDEPERSRQGVHWTPRGVPGLRPGAHLIILAGYAHDGVLAHELGHYLGNPRHSDAPGNVMSYDWGERAVPVFDRAQTRRIQRFLRRAWAAGTFDPDKPVR